MALGKVWVMTVMCKCLTGNDGNDGNVGTSLVPSSTMTCKGRPASGDP